METRIPYLQDQPGLDTQHDLIVKKRGGGERRIKSGKWWINRRTPVGEDAEVVERMPHYGRRIIEYAKIIATIETPNAVLTGAEGVRVEGTAMQQTED